jgi:hypothetical protein
LVGRRPRQISLDVETVRIVHINLHAPKRATLIAAGAIAACVALAGTATAAADPFGWWAATPHHFAANNDTVALGSGGTAHGNLLSNDAGATAVVRTSALDNPAAGSLDVKPDGSFTFAPARPDAHGTVHFTYTATDALKVYQTKLPALDTFGTVKISGGSYGSSFTPAPGRPGYFYGITDRGPNADSGDGNKVEPMSGVDPAHPAFHPRIGLFQLAGGTAKLVGNPIELKDIHGNPYNGLPNTVSKKGIAASFENIEDMNGNVLPTDPDGYDPEGLVVLEDGTFWVSDEYGPYVTHFDKTGKEIERLSPWVSGPAYDADSANHNIDTAHPLPAELQYRTKNKGMEGLTVTPDGKTLVGIMQSALTQPDLAGAKTALITACRIVTVNLQTKVMHEYVYLLDNPSAHAANAVSEITAVSNTKFLVDERDGNLGAGAFKQLYIIDLAGASDVVRSSDPRGFLINGKSIDAYVGQADTVTATKLLEKAGVTPVSKMSYLDMGALVTQADPNGSFFGHDKIEGVATSNGGKTVYLANDSDFGLDHTNEAAGPYTLHQKTLPNGKVDDGEVLAVDMTKLPMVLDQATVTIRY